MLQNIAKKFKISKESFLKRLRDFLLVLSFTNMCFFNVWAQFFYKEQFNTRYFPTVNTYLGLIVSELIVTLVFWALLQVIRRYPNPIVVRIIKFLVCLEVLCFIFVVTDSNQYVKYVLLILTIILICFKQMSKVTMKVLLITVPFVAVIFGQAVLGMIREIKAPHRADVLARPFYTQQASLSNQRVIWLIFDSFDQSIAFSNRPKGLQLPEFDRFIKESLYATQAFPPSYETVTSIPGLIDGKVVFRADYTGIDKLSYSETESSPLIPWGSRPNVFSDVRALGMNTALIGECIPYSRILGKDLNFCSWVPFRYSYTSPKDSLWNNVGVQLIGVFLTPINLYLQHKISYLEVQDLAKRMVADQRYGLIFIHSPIPHFPYINRSPWLGDDYKRKEGYCGNLQLTDKAFGKLRNVLEQAGEWDRITIIVSADHWMRDDYPHKKIDLRVPFMIKLAGEKQPRVYNRPFNTAVTRELIIAVLRNEIKNVDQLVQWLDYHGKPIKPRYVPN